MVTCFKVTDSYYCKLLLLVEFDISQVSLNLVQVLQLIKKMAHKPLFMDLARRQIFAGSAKKKKKMLALPHVLIQ